MEMKAADAICKFPAITSASHEMTERIGAALSRAIAPGALLLMYGDLGAGKTLIASAIGRSLGIERMKSPTFAIESRHEIPGAGYGLVHVDLYRLDDASDESMHISEMLDDGDAVIVEWADRFSAPPAREYIEVHLSSKYDARELIFTSRGSSATERLSHAYEEVLDVCR